MILASIGSDLVIQNTELVKRSPFVARGRISRACRGQPRKSSLNVSGGDSQKATTNKLLETGLMDLRAHVCTCLVAIEKN